MRLRTHDLSRPYSPADEGFPAEALLLLVPAPWLQV
jgi:hypothetical protein